MGFIYNDSEKIIASVVDVNPVTVALTGDENKLIRYHSEAKATMDAQSGVVLSGFEMLNSGTKVQGKMHIFNNVESNVFYFFADDDKTNVHKKIVEPEMIYYTKPICHIASELPDGESKMNVYAKGEFFNDSFGAEVNAITAQYRYKLVGGTFGEWQDMTIQIEGNKYVAQALCEGLDYAKAYTLEARVVDKLEEVTSPSITVKSRPAFHWGENDFVFEVPVTFKEGAEGITPSCKPLYINGKTYDGKEDVTADIYNGTWTPIVLIPEEEAYYSVQYGWYQKVGKVVTIGWVLKFNPDRGYENTVVKIGNVPFPPSCDAFGGGIAHNIHTIIDLIFEGWAIDTSGFITARLQHGNKLTTGNLDISSDAYYCATDDMMTLAGTICYMTDF